MPTRLPRDLIVERILGHGGPVLAVAPRGFGKTTLLSVLRERSGYRSAEECSWLPDGCEMVVGPGLVDPPTLRAALSERVPLVIATRTAVDLEAMAEHPDVLVLTHADLAFDLAELTTLAQERFGDALGAQLGRALLPATAGWPVLAAAHLDGLGRARLLPAEVMSRALERIDRNETLGTILRPVLRELSPDEVVQLSTLAHVRTFPEESAIAAAGSEFLERCRRLGLPLVTDPDGRLAFLPLVGSYLQSRHAPDQTTIKRMIPSLLAYDASMQAIRLLIGLGELDEAALIVKELRRRDLETLNPVDFLGVVSMLGPVVHRWPEVSLQHARILRRMGNLAEAKALLEEALREPHAKELAWEIEAEYCFHLAADGLDHGVLERIDRCLLAVPTSQLATRTTLLTARGVCLATSDDLEQIAESEGALLMAARQWESLGDNSFAARTLRILASTTLSELGRLVDVRRILERSMELQGGQGTNRLIVVNLLSRTAALAGDLEAFDHYDSEVESLASGASLEWAKGYAHWSRMHAASWRQEPDAVVAHHRKAAHHLGSFRLERTGAAFLAESAEAHARAGLLDRAGELLREVQSHPMRNTRMVTLASVAVSAASGAIAATREQVDRALTAEGIPQSLRWRMLFHLASASFNRTGRVDPELLHLIELEADVVGEAVWPRRLSPHFWDDANLAKVTGGRNAELGCVPETVRNVHVADFGNTAIQMVSVQVLGGFVVRNGSRIIATTPGHVSTLVKLIALRGGSVPVEVAIDLLWPEADEETGRRRFKNIISRLRKELGERSIVRSDRSIAFGINVRLDLNEFDQRARNAMVLSVARSTETVAAAVSALDLYLGAVLPHDRYDDWVEEARTFFKARADSLLDLVRSDAPPDLLPWIAATELRISNPDMCVIPLAEESAVSGYR